LASAAVHKAKRLVIKVGSALLVDGQGQIRQAWLDALADDVCALLDQGKEVILVSSGAIAVGRLHLGMPVTGELRLGDKQAAAATGQIRLAHAYQAAMARHNRTVAQILITLEDTEERQRHLNARATLSSLLKHQAVPVVNENDTVATAEIRVGDNDRLAARMASMAGADLLILFSDIDGLYTANPRTHPEARHLPLIEAITPEIEAMAGKPLPGISTGGMVTKIDAAKVAVQAGCSMLIAKGEALHPVQALLDGGLASLFQAQASPRKARKAWIAGSLMPRGSLVVDSGAERALLQGRSLLPAGVVSVEGRFSEGDPVAILNQQGQRLGVGLSAFGAEEAARIQGQQSQDIAKILGYQSRLALIHRDDLALTMARSSEDVATRSTPEEDAA
jgi:glutamate 5-kinase